MKYFWFWLFATAIIASCQSAQKAVYPPDQIVPTDKALLWKISGNGLKKPSYLYGTIHLIPKEDFRLSTSTQTALEQAKQVTFEIDMKEMTNLSTQLGLMTKAFMPGGKTLKDLLPPDDYNFVKSKMAESGLPSGMLERMKPMFLSTMMSTDEGGSGITDNAKMTSVEMEVYRIAKRKKIESAGLETAAYQMAIFDSIPYEAQAKMLVDGLRNNEGSGNEYEQMIKMYREQDINAMQSTISEEGSGIGQYEDLLLKKRNRNWIPVMGRMMREKPTFFAVGAGHLGGESGVIALLRKNGYKVEPAQ